MSLMIWSMAWGTIPQLNRDGAHRAPSLPLRQSFRGITTSEQMLRRGNQGQVPTVKTQLGINKLTDPAGVEDDLIHTMEVNGFNELVIRRGQTTI